MRNWFIGIILIVALFLTLYAVVSFWIIPASAKLTLPIKWKQIPLNQKRTVVTSYLGRSQGMSAASAQFDTWIVRVNNYEYTLTIQYSRDSVASAYSIRYHFQNLLFDKNGTVTGYK